MRLLKTRLFRWLLITVAALSVAGAAGLAGVLIYYGRDLPDSSQLADYQPPVTTRVYAADGQLMAQYATQNRIFVPIEAIPEMVRQAFISAEDQNFYSHGGVDYRGVVRAVITNVGNYLEGRRLVGASTITQQVAKNFLVGDDVSLGRKIREALVAFRMESTFTKDAILELYLNEIYLGWNSHGVAAAAMNYFDKSLSELTLSEAAFLAALPKAPNNYHPIRRQEAAIIRRNYVIGRMLEDGAITAEAAEEARAAELTVTQRPQTAVLTAPYYSEEVRREIQRDYGSDALYEGGLAVRTSMDPRLQTIAERVLRQGLINYDRQHGWRGPIAAVDGFDAWPDRLAAIDRPAGAGDWSMAVVLEVYGTTARIGLEDRSQGMIPWDELTWARPWLEGQRVGATPTSADAVLALGDIILVEAVDGLMTPPTASPGTPVDEAGTPQPLPAYGLRQIPEVQGALVAMDPHTGRVLAMSGGYSFAMSEFNRATQAARQPGSAFKPFVYLTALENGFTPASILLDTPLAVELDENMPMWRPDNFAHDYLGPVPMRVGIERSRNIMTVRLLLEQGLESVRDTAARFGIYEDMDLLYSYALGAGEVTPLDLTAAYGMLVNGGEAITPTFVDRIQDRHGETIFRHDTRACSGCVDIAFAGDAVPELPDDRQTVTDPIAAYQMVSMLEGVVQRGTGARLASLGLPLAGKTGTSNEARDTWFVGFAPDLVVGVYVGFDVPRTLGPREGGSTVAAPIFGAFMAEALADQPVAPFRIPAGVSLVRIDAGTGLPAGPGQAAILEAFRPGTEPSAAGDPARTVDHWTSPAASPSATGSTGTGTGGLY